jgi:hypothetical protein
MGYKRNVGAEREIFQKKLTSIGVEGVLPKRFRFDMLKERNFTPTLR